MTRNPKLHRSFVRCKRSTFFDEISIKEKFAVAIPLEKVTEDSARQRFSDCKTVAALFETV